MPLHEFIKRTKFAVSGSGVAMWSVYQIALATTSRPNEITWLGFIDVADDGTVSNYRPNVSAPYSMISTIQSVLG